MIKFSWTFFVPIQVLQPPVCMGVLEYENSYISPWQFKNFFFQLSTLLSNILAPYITKFGDVFHISDLLWYLAYVIHAKKEIEMKSQ